MATVVSGDSTKPSHEEDSSSDSVSNVLVLFAPRHFTLKNIASQIDLLDILIVAGVGYALKTGKLLNWIRKPWDMFKGWIEAGYTGPENELKSMAAMAKMNKDKTFSDFMDSSDSSDEEDDLLQLAQKKHSRWCLGSHKYSGTPNLKGFKGIGETYIAETYTGLRQVKGGIKGAYILGVLESFLTYGCTIATSEYPDQPPVNIELVANMVYGIYRTGGIKGA